MSLHDSKGQADIDTLVWCAVFGDVMEKKRARREIWELAQSLGIYPASIYAFYQARAKGELPLDFTVPAMNLRGMAYDMATTVFKAAKKLKVGAFVCELARSEMGYTDQTPQEFAAVVLAGAIKAGWTGPVFIQGDHFQPKAQSSGVPKEGEITAVKELIKASIESGIYNIDIDTSTLVDLTKNSPQEQQIPNIKYTLELLNYIESISGLIPNDIVLSIGGEIGHIGGKNSTKEDLTAYLNGLTEASWLGRGLEDKKGLSLGVTKISVQTGTTHGGRVMADGSVKDVVLDFKVLSELSELCRARYGLAGTVQHGASTLPDEFFTKFPKASAVEVHLSTGFQNIVMDHADFPKELLQEMYDWLHNERASERKEGWTDAQFEYKLRKKAWGQFKKQTWQIDPLRKKVIFTALAQRFEFLFTALNVINTTDLVKKHIHM